MFFNREHNSNFTKALTVLAVAGTAFLVVLTFNELKRGSYIGQTNDVQNTISVSGTGEATAVPNSARFTVEVQHEAEAVTEAQNQSTEAINEIINYLQDAGVQEENIKTTDYNISPQYEYEEADGEVRRPPSGERQLAGYEVSQRLEVTTDDTDQAGELLSGVGERGADSVSSLSFVVDDENALQRTARLNAIADARENARQLAQALGVELTGVVGYSQSGGARPLQYERAEMTADDADGGSASPQVPTGENRLETQVEVVYEIR